MTYDVTWMGILGGEGVLSVDEETIYKGRQAYVISVIGRSVGFVRKLYRVDDHSKSYFDKKLRASMRVEMNISESNYKKRKVIDFDHDNNLATYTVDEGEPLEFEIDEGSQDSFSAMYALRTMRSKIKVGEAIYIPLFEDKKKYELEVKILRKERLNLDQGMIDTLVVEPALSTEGIFKRRGKMTIWLSDDENLIPIKVRSKIFIGAFYATLRDVEGVDVDFTPHEGNLKKDNSD